MEKKVSIIVPIYNCEEYLKVCLDSIKHQTYKEFEVLLVNDGSTDKSLEIIDEYVHVDNKFKRYDKENGGVSSARNLGIKKSSGEYFFFVDSDDYIEIDALENLMKVMKEHDSDVVMGKRQWNINNKDVEDKKLVKLFEKNNYNKSVLENSDIWKVIAIHGKLFKRDFIIKNNLFFEEGMSSEDFVFTYKVNCLTDKISVIEDLTYTYRRRTGENKSITQNRLSEYNLKSRFKQMDMTYEIANSEIGKKMIERDELKLAFNTRLVRHINAFTEEVSYNQKINALKLIKNYCEQKGIEKILTKVSCENKIKYLLIKNEKLDELIEFLEFLMGKKSVPLKFNQDKIYLCDKKYSFLTEKEREITTYFRYYLKDNIKENKIKKLKNQIKKLENQIKKLENQNFLKKLKNLLKK